MKKRIVIRAEGGAEKGLGHIIRCMALAEMLRKVYEVHFITNYITPEIEQQLQETVHSYSKAATYIDAATEWAQLKPALRNNDILVLDGYCFDTPVQQLVKQPGYPLVCIDDIHAYPFLADAVINHSGGFSEKDYQLAPYTKLYAGLEYGLLRKPFREAAALKKGITLNNECLVCFGGADPGNETLKTLDLLVPQYPEMNFHIVTGNAYRNGDSLQKYAGSKQVTLYSNVDAEALCTLMQQCSVAVTSPSTTAYEYLSVKGLLYLKVIAFNQERMFAYLTENRLALPLEDFGTYPDACWGCSGNCKSFPTLLPISDRVLKICVV
jgi:UDP-2,4-diacetamido-2,4,6-trideoxy-beta-L-altropyranose hydrolase